MSSLPVAVWSGRVETCSKSLDAPHIVKYGPCRLTNGPSIVHNLKQIVVAWAEWQLSHPGDGSSSLMNPRVQEPVLLDPD